MTSTTFRDFALSEIHDNLIALNVPVRPASVRDSMYRAEQICAQLLAEGILGKGKQALVVGLGPVGMTVSATLLQSKTHVVTCNISSQDGQAVLAKCTTRMICPTTFDFPAQQWSIRDFPHDGTFTAQFGWRFGLAEDVLQHIVQKYQLAKDAFLNSLTIIDPGVLSAVSGSSDKIRATVTTPQKGEAFQDREFDAVIICTGPGPDRVVLPGSQSRYAGFSFWSNDDLLMQYRLGPRGEKVMDLRSVAQKPALVIGGGDGGIADFVRLLTGNFDPFENLDQVVLPPRFEQDLKHLSGQMWSAFNLDGTPRNHELLVRTQLETIRVLDDAWGSASEVRDWAHRLLLPPTERPFVQLAIPCYHFKISYFANRIAAQLLARALATDIQSLNGGLVPFRVGVLCTDIQPIDTHSCIEDALDCSRYWHRAMFARHCCEGAAGPENLEYWQACSQEDPMRPWKRTATDDTSDAIFARIFLRLSTEKLIAGLPANVCEAINRRAPMPIRDALSCYTNCK